MRRPAFSPASKRSERLFSFPLPRHSVFLYIYPGHVMYRLLLAAVFLSTSALQTAAQTALGTCPGHPLGAAPYKLRAVLEAFCIPVPANIDPELSIQYGAYNGPSEF